MTNYTDIIGKREIEFRAWDKNDLKMIDLIQLFGGAGNPAVNAKINAIIYAHDNIVGGKGDLVFMQYTGLCDKNGTKIFEGDIVAEIYGHNGVVQFGKCMCNGEYPAYGFHVNGELFGCWNTSDTVVIGNYFQNPELLPTN